MGKNVLNTIIGSDDVFQAKALSVNEEQEELATLFEQLLIFEQVTIRTNRTNDVLVMLIRNLGITTVEKLVKKGYIRFILWSPIIISNLGSQLDDGTMDESRMYELPPISSGTLTDEDLDIQNNIEKGLAPFHFIRAQKRQLIRDFENAYDTINGMNISKDTTQVILDAYRHNNLAELGLPYNKEPQQMNKDERLKLLSLSHKVLETAVLSIFQLKSYNNYEHLKICEKNLENIGRGYNVAGNSSHIFQLQNLPNLREAYKSLRFDFETVFEIRNLRGAKFYRKWINDVGDYADANFITQEYFREIKGKRSYFNTTDGKLIKSSFFFGLGAAIDQLIKSHGIATLAGYSLSLLETYLFDSLLNGYNPSMFVENMQKQVALRS